MRTFAWLLLVVSLMTACAQPQVPEDRFYRLDLGAPEKTLGKPRLDGTLEIERFVADGLTAGRSIVYSDSARPHQVQAYHYHYWIEPPIILLRDELVAYLRAAGVAGKVVTPELRTDPEYVLTGRINRLEQAIGSPPGAVVDLELSLRRAADATVLLLRTYRVEAKANTATVPAAVTAINGVLKQIFAQFAADMEGI